MSFDGLSSGVALARDTRDRGTTGPPWIFFHGPSWAIYIFASRCATHDKNTFIRLLQGFLFRVAYLGLIYKGFA